MHVFVQSFLLCQCLGVLTDVRLCGVGIVICFVKDCSTVRFIQL